MICMTPLRRFFFVEYANKSNVVGGGSGSSSHICFVLCFQVADSLCTMPTPPFWQPDDAHKCCVLCGARFTFFRRRHHCRKCGRILCANCSRCRVSVPIGNAKKAKTVRVCGLCSCPILTLPDSVLQYVQLFLQYSSQDRLLRVCHRFQQLIVLPFLQISSIQDRFDFIETRDLISRSRTGCVLKCFDRVARQPRAIKVVAKRKMYCRRDWQMLQTKIDVMTRTKHQAFPCLFEVVQSPREVILVMELISSSYVSLDELAETRHFSCENVVSIMRSLFEAMSHLHSDLKAVHRGICGKRILVDPAQCSVRIVGLKYCKFCTLDYLAPIAASSPLAPAMSAPYRNDSIVANSTSISSPTRCEGTSPTQRDPPTPPPASPKPGAFSHREVPVRRPPPLEVPRDDFLERRSQLYRRTAAERTTLLSTESRKSCSFTRPAMLSSFSMRAMEIKASPRGCPRFTAPEVTAMFASGCSSCVTTVGELQKWDVFSLGVVMYVLLCGKPPWDSDRWGVLAVSQECVAAYLLPATNSRLKNVTAPCIDLLGRLLASAPSSRISCKEALLHEAMKVDPLTEIRSPPPPPRLKRKAGK